MLQSLEGYKTYLVVVAGVLLYGSESMGLIPEGTVAKVNELLVLLGLGALRAGIAKIK